MSALVASAEADNTVTSEIVVDDAALRAAALMSRYGQQERKKQKHTHNKEQPRQNTQDSSFGAESAVLLAMAAEVDPAVPVAFRDTGKLFGETLTYRDKLSKHLGLTNVITVKPDPVAEAELDKPGTLWRDNPDACRHFR